MTEQPVRCKIRAGEHDLEAARWGDPSNGPAILLLHEGLGCVALWRDFPERLSEATGLTVVAYSRSGYGMSAPCTLPRPLDYMEQEAAILPKVLEALDIKRHILVGHSDGGSIAALAAADAPENLLGMVLMAPHFFVEDVSITAIEQARDAYETGGLQDRLARYHADPDAAFRGWNDAWLDPGFRRWDITWTIPKWRVPVLAIQGHDDPYGTAAQVEAVRRASSSADVHLIPGCGHAPHLEAPQTTLDLIADFVNRCTA